MARGGLSHESLLAYPLHTGCLHRFLPGNWTCKLLAFLLSLAEARRRGNHLAKPRTHPSMVSRTGLQILNDNLLYIYIYILLVIEDQSEPSRGNENLPARLRAWRRSMSHLGTPNLSLATAASACFILRAGCFDKEVTRVQKFRDRDDGGGAASGRWGLLLFCFRDGTSGRW